MMMNQIKNQLFRPIYNFASVTVIEPRPKLAHLLCSTGSASGEYKKSGFHAKRSNQNPNLNHHQCLAEVVSGNETVAGAVLNCTGREGKQLISQVLKTLLDIRTLHFFVMPENTR